MISKLLLKVENNEMTIEMYQSKIDNLEAENNSLKLQIDSYVF